MFDAYYKWLGILPKDQPPNHYRLLSLELFESDLDVIEGAADRAMSYIRQYQSGEHAPLAAKLLNEIAAARLCLLKPKSKAAYDAKLKTEQAIAQAPEDAAPNFEIDSELNELLKAPAIPGRSRRKKTKPIDPVRVGSAIAAIVCALILIAFLSRNSTVKNGQVDRTEVESTDTVKAAPQKSLTAEAKTEAAQASDQLAIESETKVETALEPNVEATGPVIDLIANVDLSRDLLTGEWKKDGSSLTGGPNSRLYLPAEFPSSYQLKFTIKRTAGSDGCCFGFSSEGRAGLAMIDGWNSAFSGICVDGREPDHNCTSQPGAFFQNGRKSTVILTVHPRHVRATTDGKKAIDWYGESRRHFVPSFIGVPSRETPFVATLAGAFRIDAAELTPIEPDVEPDRAERLDEWLEIMPVLNADRDAVHGVWSVTNNVLHSSPGAHKNFGMLALSVPVPKEYTLSTSVQVAADSRGRKIFVFGLPVGESYCTIPIVDPDDCLGIEEIDGLRWDNNESRMAGKYLESAKPIKCDVTVTKQGVRMEFDGRTVINWIGESRRLSPQVDWAPPDARKLFFGTETHFEIRDIKIGPPIDPPDPPSHPKIAIKQPLDLLSLIETKHDALSGTWSKDNTGLRVMGDVPVSKLVIPCEVPEEYQLTLSVTRETGGPATHDFLLMNLPIGSCMAQVILDAFASTVNGINIDRLSVDHPLNGSSRKLQAILPGSSQEIVVTVRKTGIKVVNGHRTIIEWSGNPDRLWMRPEWSTPAGRIAIGSNHSRFRFEKLEIEPLPPSTMPHVAKLGRDGNVMSVIDVRRDSRKGQWTGSVDGIISPAGFPGSRLDVPLALPKNYVVTAEVERRKGRTQFCLGLVVGGHECNVVIDGGDHEAGLERLDDKPFQDSTNSTHQVYPEPLLPAGKRVQIRCHVLPHTVLVTCGDKEIIRWHGDPRRFSLEHLYRPSNHSETDRARLWLGSWDAEFLIRKLTLKPLSDDEVKKLTDSFARVVPVTSPADVTQPEVASPVPANPDSNLANGGGTYQPVSIKKAATIVSSKEMFFNGVHDEQKLIFPDWSPKTVDGIPFELVDPEGGQTPNAIMLYGDGGDIPPRMPKSVSVTCNSRAKAIHLLSGVSGFGWPGTEKGGTILIVRLKYSDGKTEDHTLLNGVHFADYVNRVDVPKSKFAFDLRGQQIRYLSIVPGRPEKISSIDFIKGGGVQVASPIVMAITIETTPQEDNATPVVAPKPDKSVKAPEVLAKAKWHDLLNLVQLPDNAIAGQWEKREGSLVCDASADSRFMVPVAVRGSYELNCDFTRNAGDEYVAVVFPIGPTFCSLGLGLDLGTISGLELIDGEPAAQFPKGAKSVVRPGALTNEKRYQLHIEVTQNNDRVMIKSTLDGKPFVSWQGSYSQLSCPPIQALPVLQCIGVVSNQSETEIHKLEIKLKNDAKAYALASDWKNPLAPVAANPPDEIAAQCVTWNGRCYYVSDDVMPYTAALALAAKLNGRLLTVSSKEEEAFVYKLGNVRNLWTAGWRRQGSEEWRDERNRPLRYTSKWAPNQPTLNPRELYLFIDTKVGEPRGAHDCFAWDVPQACIEWGEEYAVEK